MRERELLIRGYGKRPRLLIANLLAFLLVMPAFYSAVSFTDAVTPRQALRQGKPLPPGWTAGVMNHGEYYRWWTIQERPYLYWTSEVVLWGGLLLIWGSLLWIHFHDRKETQ